MLTFQSVQLFGFLVFDQIDSPNVTFTQQSNLFKISGTYLHSVLLKRVGRSKRRAWRWGCGMDLQRQWRRWWSEIVERRVTGAAAADAAGEIVCGIRHGCDPSKHIAVICRGNDVQCSIAQFEFGLEHFVWLIAWRWRGGKRHKREREEKERGV